MTPVDEPDVPLDELFLALDPEDGQLRFGNRLNSPVTLPRLTADVPRTEIELDEGRRLEIWPGAGRRWFDSPAEMSIDGNWLSGNYGRERFWVRAWYYSLGLPIFLLTTMSAAALAAVVLKRRYGDNGGLFAQLGSPLTTLMAILIPLALFLLVQRFFLSRPIPAFYLSGLLTITFWLGGPFVTSEVTSEGTWDGFSLPGLWIVCGFLLLFRQCRLSLNRLTATGHPQAPLKGPWISWHDVPFETPPAKPTRWLLL